MKKTIAAVALLALFVLSSAKLNNRTVNVPTNTSDSLSLDSTVSPLPLQLENIEIDEFNNVITEDSVFIGNLALSLTKIPKAKTMYKAAKPIFWKWAKLFVIMKVQESGADGKNSYYAKKYNNLCGMRCVKRRKTKSSDCGKNNYAIYPSWYHSMVDWKFYMDNIERKYIKKHGREPKDEFEVVDFLYGYYNSFPKWRKDLRWLLKHYPVK